MNHKITDDGGIIFNVCSPKETKPILISSIILLIVAIYVPLVLVVTLQVFSYKALLNSTSNNQIASQPARVQRIRRVNRTFLLVIITFFLMTLPIGIITPWVYYGMFFKGEKVVADKDNTFFQVASMSQLLLTANSSVNPIIYSKVHIKIKKLLRRC